MFSRKKDIPLLTYFILRVNLSASNKWVTEPTKISPIREIEWVNSNKGEHPNTKEYKITLLPNDPFTFYHKGANELSPSIGGIDALDDENIRVIEWSWDQSYFSVRISHPPIPILYIPINEILCLLKTGKTFSQKNPLKNEKVISLGFDEDFDEICQIRHSNALMYSNELASLFVVRAGSSDLVDYTE